MQDTMRLNKLSLEIEEKNKAVTNHQNILITDYALQQSAHSCINTMFDLSFRFFPQYSLKNACPLRGVFALIFYIYTLNNGQ